MKALKLTLAAGCFLGLAGCMGSGENFTLDERQGRDLGRGIGGALGQALNEAAGGDRVVGAILNQRNGQLIGGALGEAAAANQGSCNRDLRIDNRTGRVTSDTSRCGQQHGIPSNLRF